MKFFAAPWPHVSVISLVDILLVAVIIYELLALIKGTRAAYMLVGVAGLALVFYFSRAGEASHPELASEHAIPMRYSR